MSFKEVISLAENFLSSFGCQIDKKVIELRLTTSDKVIGRDREMKS